MKLAFTVASIASLLAACSSKGSPPPDNHAGGAARDATGGANAAGGGAGGALFAGRGGGTGGTGGTGGRAADGGMGAVGGVSSSAGVVGVGGIAGAANSQGPTFSEFVGINGFIDDDKTKLAAVGNVREYHEWSWTDASGVAYPNNPLEFSRWQGFWDFDDYYRTLRDAGALVVPCLQGSVAFLGDRMPPVPENADRATPASYAAHASLLFQYAARYGSTKVAEPLLKLADGQVVASGLGLLRYFENGNEPDANWVNPDGSFLFEPEETAAMSSADYDGHLGALGITAGIKNADPSSKLVMAGLAGSGPSDWLTNVTTYFERIRAWATIHRGGSFPADVLNVHYYCFGPDPFGTANPRPGLSPEACDLRGLLKAVSLYRDRELPGKELWLTEFGYDTHPRSRLRAPAIGANSAEVVQGQWLLRSVLALLPSGIDRAFLFVSRDSCTGTDSACPDNHIQFATSGVLTQKEVQAPKPAWHFLATFRTRLGAMRYQGELAATVPNLSIARFYDAATDRGAYVLWSPTSNATVIDSYPLSVRPGLPGATLVTLQADSATGIETPSVAVNGTIPIRVTETPTIVLVSGQP